MTVSDHFYLLRLDCKLTKDQKNEVQSNASYPLLFEDKVLTPRDENGVPQYGITNKNKKVTHIYHDKYENIPELVQAIEEYLTMIGK